MIISVIAGTKFSLRHMSAFDLVLMIGVFSVGLGLFLKGLLGIKKDSDNK